MEDLRGRGIVFEEYDLPDFKTVDGVSVRPDDNGTAWFKDTESNIIGIGTTHRLKRDRQGHFDASPAVVCHCHQWAMRFVAADRLCGPEAGTGRSIHVASVRPRGLHPCRSVSGRSGCHLEGANHEKPQTALSYSGSGAVDRRLWGRRDDDHGFR
jgi:hypothetical protein